MAPTPPGSLRGPCHTAGQQARAGRREITVYEGQHVQKGSQLGMFRFGGSTRCLLFRPGVNLMFDLHGQKAGLKSGNIPVNSQIDKVVR